MNTPPSHPPVRRGSPVLQTLLIAGLLLAGLVAAGFILRTEKKTPPAGEAHEEKPAGHEHGHGPGPEAKGHVEFTPAQRENAHLGLETAGPATVRRRLPVFGKIVPDEEKLAHVSPRFAGVVQKVSKRLGETVAAGDVLATVESNETLRSYDLKVPLPGTIIERNVSPGEFVSPEKSLFTVADLGTVWVDFQVSQQDFARLAIGQPVRISLGRRSPRADPRETPGAPGEEEVASALAYLSPFGAETTQTLLARASAPNPTGALRPGLFVTGEVAIGEVNATVAVREAALQTLEGKDVVFVEEGDGFEARPVKIGERDQDWAEILSGVQVGDRYVAGNSFLLKAEIGKEGAAHED